VQTFLPYASFERCARVLDNRRLHNQVNEALIIYRTLTGYYGEDGGWPNHAAVRMWRTYTGALLLYRNAMIRECRRRGLGTSAALAPVRTDVRLPRWLHSRKLHASHRSQLLHKDHARYKRFGWHERPGALPYHWPA